MGGDWVVTESPSPALVGADVIPAQVPLFKLIFSVGS